MRTTVILGATILLSAASVQIAVADPWKDESGNRRYERSYDDDRRDRGDRYGGNYVPRGHLPPSGLCRVWYEDRPAGQQPPPVNCERAERLADRTGGVVVNSRGRIQDQDYRDYGRRDRYDNPARGGYAEQVCAVYDSRGNCVRTGYLPR